MGTREHFEHELGIVRADLITLGQMASTAVWRSLVSLERREPGWARQVIAGDPPINEASQQVEAHALQLIATQQPVATDLRRLIAAIKIGGELERIADYGKGIAHIVVRYADQLPATLPPDLLALGTQAKVMLDAALAAFADQDVAAAKALLAEDDVADALYKRAEGALIALIQADPTAAELGAGLLLVAHHLERTADRATNLAERVVFMAVGEIIELNP